MPDLEAVTLRDPLSSLTATYVPNAGMIGTSLSDGGVELLGQRRGLQAYVSTQKTMGIPILYPWANRLSSNGYGVDGAVVTLTPGTGGVRTDQHGVPIHGTLAAYPGWNVTTQLESQLSSITRRAQACWPRSRFRTC
jgi:aldose 1-epimerase